MTIDSRLVTIPPDQSNGIIANGLNVAELEVTPLDELDGSLVSLAVRAWAEAPQELVWIHAPMSIGPVDLHHSCPSGRAKLHGLGCVTHGTLPSQLPEAVAVRSRTVTVAWIASSSASASSSSCRSRSGQGSSGSSFVD